GNLKWKISAHSAAMGGLAAMMFRLAASHQAVCDLNVWLSVTVVLVGLVMTARVYLQCHTLMQVLAGALNGFVCVWFCTMIHLPQ
uniref:phosphatase PAP2 family protein n=1 Tax=uncultured Duncaniella sp. TaxID=2768039 RepID=UPI00265F5FB3